MNSASASEEREDLVQLRSTIRRFVDREMSRADARKWDAQDIFPRDVFARLIELGVTGVTIPEEYGGTGIDVVSAMTVIEELSRRSLAVAVPYIMCSCYCGMNIGKSGSPEQKASILPKVARGEILYAYGLTEPDVGADIASVKTTARIVDDRVIVNGAKRFCTGANIADYILTLVRSGEPGARHRNLSLVIIPTGAPGVRVEVTDSIGMKGAPTTDVWLDEVTVRMEDVVAR